MATTTARNRQDVDSMSKADRVWDSLNYSYGKKRESSDREYDKAISQADRQALNRGMQRSSYNNQVLGNLGNQKIQTQNDIWDAQIADYENRLGQIEQQEEEKDRWERQFAAEREDAQWNKDYQQQQADRSQNNWQLQFDADRADTAWNQAFQQGQADTAKDQWERQFGYGQQSDAQQIAMQYALGILQNGQMPSDDMLARAGISRADAEKLIAQAKGGGRRTPQPEDEGPQGDGDTEGTREGWYEWVMNYAGKNNITLPGGMPSAIRNARTNPGTAQDPLQTAGMDNISKNKNKNRNGSTTD